VTERYFNVQ